MSYTRSLGTLPRCQASATRWLPSHRHISLHMGSRGFAMHAIPQASPALVASQLRCAVRQSPCSQKNNMAGVQTCNQHLFAQRTVGIRCHASASGQTKDDWEIKMLYDGDCPLCMREVNMLRKRDKDQNKIGFVDISSQEYSPKDNAGITYEQAMGSIHGILPGGKIITNVDVFRKLYEVVGLGWVYSITRLGPINKLANRVYAVWAKYRLPITGRPDIETVLRQKKETCR